MHHVSPKKALLQQAVMNELRAAAQQRLTQQELQQVSFQSGREVMGPPHLLAKFIPSAKPPPRNTARPR